MNPCARKVNPATLSKFTRSWYYRPQECQLPCDDEEEEPLNESPMEHPQDEPMPQMHPRTPIADPYVDQHLNYLVRQDDFIISALVHQDAVNANFYNHQVAMVDQINAMAAQMNIKYRMQPLPDYPKFEEQPPPNPFNEEWDD